MVIMTNEQVINEGKKLQTINVLLVEDITADARLVSEYLKESDNRYKFIITHVDCVAKAVLEIMTNSFDVVLLDLALPDCIGLETFKKIKEQDAFLPIIILSGTTSTLPKNDLLDCLNGAQRYLLKRYTDSKNLVQAILDVISKRDVLKKMSIEINKVENKN